MHPRAGQRAQPDDLIDLSALVEAYYDRAPDPTDRGQRVSFGTSGHRGSSLDGAFNENHIAAITQAIVEFRAHEGITGPILVGRDTHGLSEPAWQTALEVLAGNGVETLIDSGDGFTPTPAVSHAILRLNGARSGRQADGILITPSHNPPRDGGFKYNPPTGGPAGSAATSAIAARANAMLEDGLKDVRRVGIEAALRGAGRYDFLGHYVDDLPNILDLEAVRRSKVKIGADPLGGASVGYWGEIATRHRLDLVVVNETVDPLWAFMPLDTDGKIRMDCSSPAAMANLIATMRAPAPYDIATGNDADADRHGIVTADGLMNPNHYLAVAIDYLFRHRPQWGSGVVVGKTLVSSSMIDRVTETLGRRLLETPVGFKYFVPGLFDGSVGFGGEESAGATFLRHDGTVWTTDKDGLLLALLAAEIMGATGQSPSENYDRLTQRHGTPAYARVDAPASREQKARLAALSPADVTADILGGDPILQVLTTAPGNGDSIGGVKVVTQNAWFAARPSGTEDVYKIYAESFVDERHLSLVQDQAREVVGKALKE